MTQKDTTSRRTFVRSAAAAGSAVAAASVAGCAMPGLDPREEETPAVKDEDRDPNSGEQPDYEGSEEPLTDVGEIRLEALAEGWEGVEPESIAGDVNPLLLLEVGTEYEIIVENGDGEEHTLELRDEDDEVLESSEEVETDGDTATLAFEASTDVARYVCEYHEDRMRGTIEFPEGSESEA